MIRLHINTIVLRVSTKQRLIHTIGMINLLVSIDDVRLRRGHLDDLFPGNQASRQVPAIDAPSVEPQRLIIGLHASSGVVAKQHSLWALPRPRPGVVLVVPAPSTHRLR